ncbi:inactive pancreatic lipase-related protein 1-like [Daphnia carinata]|uniref:inactive pancreatic lipase-related protein 1-like n=1 Tax=Daphnia carinata TaxID=120202 RepID=UPI00257E73F8|nr:inactive pancreatic lipase-related protein 1-like [Daphnia carinata]
MACLTYHTAIILLCIIASNHHTITGSVNLKAGPETVLFELFTRNNPDVAQVLQVDDIAVLEQSNYNTSLPTKIFAHGWVGFPDQGYSSKNEYLLREDCNFISVDWSILAAGDYTFVAINNVPVAGAATGAFVDFLVNQGTPLSSFHLIGFSMGAHVVGNAGGLLVSGKLPRITGLDPAANDFPLESLDTRLDTTDASFVDVIHTSSVAFISATGHADFYPNGGVLQPGCPVPDSGCCNHCRVVDLYAESINTQLGFNAFACDSWENYQSGYCNQNAQAQMGERVSVNAQGLYYLATNSQPPYAQG